jgi:Rubredoxin
MKVGSGEADCLSCGYRYDPKQGDPNYPVNPGTRFQVCVWPQGPAGRCALAVTPRWNCFA